MENFLDLASEMTKHNDFMSIVRNMGFTGTDPMDNLMVFDEAFTAILNSRTKVDSDEPIVGSLDDHTPPPTDITRFYYNPYAAWINVLLLPALAWASAMAIVGGPWEFFVYTFRNGFDNTYYSKYVLM